MKCWSLRGLRPDLRCIKGRRRHPFPCFAKLFARCPRGRVRRDPRPLREPRHNGKEKAPLLGLDFEMVEPSITKANTVISLETCYLQINRNWFAVIGNLQNTR